MALEVALSLRGPSMVYLLPRSITHLVNLIDHVECWHIYAGAPDHIHEVINVHVLVGGHVCIEHPTRQRPVPERSGQGTIAPAQCKPQVGRLQAWAH